MPVARALGFGILLGITQIDTIPVRNFGGRTAALVRSVLRRCFGHVFWRVRWDVAGSVPGGAPRCDRGGWLGARRSGAIRAPLVMRVWGAVPRLSWHRAIPSSPVLDRSSRPPRAPGRHSSDLVGHCFHCVPPCRARLDLVNFHVLLLISAEAPARKPQPP